MEWPNEDYNMERLTEGDQVSSGQSPAHPQGFDHRTEKFNSHGNVPVIGAPDGDEEEPSVVNKITLAPSLDNQQVATHSRRPEHPAESYRVPYSDQLPVPAPFKGFDNRTEKGNSRGKLPVSGAQDGDESKPSKKKNMSPAPKTGPQVAPHSGRPNHRGESHRVPDSDQGFDNSQVKESSYESLPVSGAPDSDKIKKNKKTPVPRTAPDTTWSHRVPDSAVPATFKKQSGAEVQSGDRDSSGPSPPDPEEIEDLKASLESVHQQIADLQRDNTELRSIITAIMSEKQSGAEVQSDDQASSGPSPTDTQGDGKSQVEESSGNLPVSVSGTPDSDKIKTKKTKKTPAPKMTPDTTESHRVPDSDQLMSVEVPPDLHIAVETLGKYYPDQGNDPSIKKFFQTLGQVLKEPDSESSKTSSSHAGTVKVHKIVTGKTFGADEALLKQLNCKELQVEMTDRQGCDIIILFCPIKSRVRSDVELAMRQVSGEERVILILMHHTRDVDYSTAAKRWSETFGNVVFDINVLYHETVPGLLMCPKNTEAISDIRKELMQYSSSTNQSKNNWSWSIGSLFGRGK